MNRCIELYASIPFITSDDSFDQTTITMRMARVAVLHWGFEYIVCRQSFKNGVELYLSVIFTNPSGEFSTAYTYALHLCNGSWIEERISWGKRISEFVKRYYRQPHKAAENLYKKCKSLLLR